MINPFLVASRDLGGLAMTTDQVGIAYGTIGILFLTIGGILGGMFASKLGLRRSMWIMAAFMTLPCLSFVYLGVYQPENIYAITTAIAVEQFGYGFGFTAYMLYLIYFSDGEFKTAHYSLCTAFMALSMMLPGMVAGYIQESLGYTNFFIFVMVCCMVTVGVTMMVKVDSEYGRK
jgi:PAT family beta-lactamase induction signal transducer AmpG